MRSLFRYIPAALAALCLMAGCEREIAGAGENSTVLSISLAPDAKTYMGAADGQGNHKIYWSNGDRLALNGVASNALSGLSEQTSTAHFVFDGVHNYPFCLLYPASFYKNATTVTLPATQDYAAESFATGTNPMAAYMAGAGEQVSMAHLCATLHLKIKKDASVDAGSLATVSFSGKAGEQVCGDFTIDYENHTLTPAGSGSTVTMNVNQTLSTENDLNLYLVLPAQSYASGFSVTFTDNAGRTMTKSKSTSISFAAGTLTSMPALTFVPDPVNAGAGIDDIEEEVLAPDVYNVKGRVVDNVGQGLEGVVVSDGEKCVLTCSDGSFYIDSDLSAAKYVQISTPAGYMPEVSGGKPKFYKRFSDITPQGGIYDFGDFVVYSMLDPKNFSIFFTADLQPRSRSATWDNFAYHGLDVCRDLYRDLQETAAPIIDAKGVSQVIGICLGDIVHENMDNMTTYANEKLPNLGYATYNVIGNHDYNTSAADDDEGAAHFESLFGPRNYSFNMGNMHFVILDNIQMYRANGELSSYYNGLKDRTWSWLQRDLAFVPKSTTIMLCAHGTMFRTETGSERGSNENTLHGAEYQRLFSTYDKVYDWAGHSHSTFNYIYESGFRKGMEVHILARSCGELWTNEYLCNGTPRGYVIVDVKNGDIDSWHFHPLKYQKNATFIGSNGQPAYTWRDWDYNSSGVAIMRDSGQPLDDSYQIHAYPPRSYGDNYVYANVFMWDSKWGIPSFRLDSGAWQDMTRITEGERYDLANREFQQYYKEKVSTLAASDSYKVTLDSPQTMFRVPCDAEHGTGTVSVQDRFGKLYTRTISW